MVLNYNHLTNTLKMKQKELKTETISDRLKQLRDHLGKTQAEFYAMTGVTITTQSNGGALSRKTIDKVIQKTGVNREWFVDGVGEMNITPVEHVETGFNPWKEEAYQNLKEEVKYLKGLVTLLAGNKSSSNFPKALNQEVAGLISYLDKAILN